MSHSILIVEDNRALAQALAARVEAFGYPSRLAPTLTLARKELERQDFAAVILDLGLPDGSGQELLDEWSDRPGPAFAVLTAHGDLEHVIDARQAGAKEFFFKPVDFDALGDFLRQQVATAPEPTPAERASPVFVASAPAMRPVLQGIASACRGDRNVLITGARGTGRSQVVRLIRSHLPEGLPVQELEPVASAVLPERGVIVIDQADRLPLDLQVRLARELDAASPVLIATSSTVDLRQAVNRHEMHPDFYYRLQGLSIKLPPLAERREDLPALCTLFLGQMDGPSSQGLTREAARLLAAHPWSGNLIELKEVLLFAKGKAGRQAIAPEHLPAAINDPAPGKEELPPLAQAVEDWLSGFGESLKDTSYAQLSAEIEKTLLERLLPRFDYKPAVLARELALNRTTLRSKLRKLGIDAKGRHSSG